MEQTNEGRCPVGGVPPHGSEHVMVLLIPVVRGTSDDWIERSEVKVEGLKKGDGGWRRWKVYVPPLLISLITNHSW